MSVRKELLERELSKLGFRKAGAGGPGHEGGASHPQQQQQQQQHQPQTPSEGHPQADAKKPGGEHSE